MTIFTIGYEGLDTQSFISLLIGHEIEAIVDVRDLPLSRKPGFSKSALSKLLDQSGLDYVHIASLGCPKHVRDGYKEDKNLASYKKAFQEHLGSQGKAIQDLSIFAQLTKCALLCYEADFNLCHRSMVASAVRELCGADIVHIRI